MSGSGCHRCFTEGLPPCPAACCINEEGLLDGFTSSVLTMLPAVPVALEACQEHFLVLKDQILKEIWIEVENFFKLY